MITPITFASYVHSAIEITPITKRLSESSAVVLERIARGGGATNWYSCADPISLRLIEARLQPGRVVSFYFDGRIQSTIFSDQVLIEANKFIINTGEVLIGSLNNDKIAIDMFDPSSLQELHEFIDELTSDRIVFYGVFPARDNDGVSAITLTIPDMDGIIRGHPH